MHIPEDLVPNFVVGDDIDNWFKAYEVALEMHRIPKEDWKHIPSTDRDTCLSLGEAERMNYSSMKGALVLKFGLTAEKYHIKFRESQMISEQNLVDCVTHFTKTLDGWGGAAM